MQNESNIAVVLRLLVVVFAMLSLSSCSHEKRSQLSLALIPMGTTDEYWRTIHAGAEKAAAELGVTIIWQGPMRRDDRSAQCDVVDNMIVRRVDGIVLAPVDNMALRGPVEDAYRSQIPVLIIDSDLQSDKIVSYIATHNYKGGFMGGQFLGKLLGGKGDVVLLRGVEGNASTDHRERGFLDALKTFPEIKLVSANQHGGGTSETAYKASENILSQFKSADGKLKIDGIFCPNESTSFGMLRALQDGGFAGKVHFVGFDSSKKLNQAIERKEIDGLVVQDPMTIGYLGIKAMVDSIQGKKIEKRVDVPAVLVTRDNMNDAEVHALLNPPLERWLK